MRARNHARDLAAALDLMVQAFRSVSALDTDDETATQSARQDAELALEAWEGHKAVVGP